MSKVELTAVTDENQARLAQEFAMARQSALAHMPEILHLPDPELIEDPISQTNRKSETEAKDGRDLRNGAGGGNSTPMTESDLKPRVDFLHTAFLWLAGLMITALIAIITVILTASSGTNARLDKVNDSIAAMNRDVGTVGSKVDEASRRLDRIENKLDAAAAASLSSNHNSVTTASGRKAH